MNRLAGRMSLSFDRGIVPMMDETHDPEVDAYYFADLSDDGWTRTATRTVSLGLRTVNVDYDQFGYPIGIEVL